MKSLTIKTPTDWHLHVRSGEPMFAVVPHTAAQFGAALIMPNLVPPVTTASMAAKYRESLLWNDKTEFNPYMTLYITDQMTPADIHEAQKYPYIVAAKYYPPHGTTNSANGLTDWNKAIPVLDAMAETGMVLCVHGETLKSQVFGDETRGGRVGVLRREEVFMQETAEWLVKNFPNLKIVFEHITTREAVEFVKRAPPKVAATITAHHLLATLDDVIDSHHNKCMPILKEEHHRQALLDAATSSNPKFFAGTDSAPHAKSKKETACGCAGCYTALHALELYATAFEERENALDYIEDFVSIFGTQFYGVEAPSGTVTLHREEWTIPDEVHFGENEALVPFWAGRTLQWKAKKD